VNRKTGGKRRGISLGQGISHSYFRSNYSICIVKLGDIVNEKMRHAVCYLFLYVYHVHLSNINYKHKYFSYEICRYVPDVKPVHSLPPSKRSAKYGIYASRRTIVSHPTEMNLTKLYLEDILLHIISELYAKYANAAPTSKVHTSAMLVLLIS
jgi:hypothetical protein